MNVSIKTSRFWSKAPTESSCRQSRPGRSSSGSRLRLCTYTGLQVSQFRVFCESVPRQNFTRAFLLFLEQQRAHEYYCLTKNEERITLPSTTSDRQKARVNRKNVCKSKAWRDGVNLKAHIASRALPLKIPVRGRFFERRFQPLSVGGFFSNQLESIIYSRCPKTLFQTKTQNRQTARTSHLTFAPFTRLWPMTVEILIIIHSSTSFWSINLRKALPMRFLVLPGSRAHTKTPEIGKWLTALHTCS